MPEALRPPQVYAFINGRFGPDDLVGVAIAEDGTALVQHVSSSESWAKHDLGVTGTWKHELYLGHYPDGFTVVWVDDPETHEGLQRAIAANREAADA